MDAGLPPGGVEKSKSLIDCLDGLACTTIPEYIDLCPQRDILLSVQQLPLKRHKGMYNLFSTLWYYLASGG